MRRRAFITLLGGAAAWPLAAQGEQPPLQLRLERRAQVSGQRAGKLAFVSMIGLLSSRPPFGRIEQPAEIGSRATDGRPLEQALAEIAVVAAWAFEQD